MNSINILIGHQVKIAWTTWYQYIDNSDEMNKIFDKQATKVHSRRNECFNGSLWNKLNI